MVWPRRLRGLFLLLFNFFKKFLYFYSLSEKIKINNDEKHLDCLGTYAGYKS